MHIFTTGGTIDKIYFDALSEYQIGEPQISRLLDEAKVEFPYHVTSLLKKDSLDITDSDRLNIVEAVKASRNQKVLITHGTDTMVDTAKALAKSIQDKTIVLVGAMQPARLIASDAVYNIGFATAACQILPYGVYIAMNGTIFTPDNVHKDRASMTFKSGV
jgi:L-asparaginase